MITKRETALNNINAGWAKCHLWSDELKNDDELMKLACLQSIQNLEFASNRLRNDKPFLIKMFRVHKGRRYSYSHQDNAIRIIEFASNDLKDDTDFMKLAISYDERLIKYANERLIHDISFILTVMKNNIDVYYELPLSMKREKELALYAAKNNVNIEDMPSEVKSDKEIVLACINQIHEAYHSYWVLPKDMQEDPEILKLYLYKITENLDDSSVELPYHVVQVLMEKAGIQEKNFA